MPLGSLDVDCGLEICLLGTLLPDDDASEPVHIELVAAAVSRLAQRLDTMSERSWLRGCG